MKTLCNSKHAHLSTAVLLLLPFFHLISRLFSITTKLSVSKSAHTHKSQAEKHQGYGGLFVSIELFGFLQ